MKHYILSLASIVCLLGGIGTAQGKQVQIALLVDGLDGCGCLPPFDDPISCPPCPSGVFNGFPNPDTLGGGSGNCEINWLARGYAADFSADNSVVVQGYASQRMSIGLVAYPVTRATFNNDFILMSHNNPSDTCCAPFDIGRFNFEAARVAQGLPAPDPNTQVKLTFQARRNGDGGCVETHAGVLFNFQNIQPPDAVGTVVAKANRVLPNNAQWNDITVMTFNKFPTSMQFGVTIELGPNGCAPVSQVDLNIDSIRLLYTATVPDTETVCNDGIDNDFDGLTDCLDPDCASTQVCTGCAHDPVYDVDDDGDVDQDDFGVFQTCITGANDPGNVFNSLSDTCKCMDKTGPGNVRDKAIDQQDFGVFQICATGPNPAVPVSKSCDD